MKAFKMPLKLLLVALALGATALAWMYFVRPGVPAYNAHKYVSAPAAPGQLTATWFGVTAVLLSDGEHSIFIDPFFTRPPGLLNLLRNKEIAPDEALIAEWLVKSGVKKLDAVLVSHSHYDHAMDAGVVARQTGAVLIGSASTANIGRSAGLPESQIAVIHSGDEATIGPFKVTFIESRHAGATGGAPTGDIMAPLQAPFHYLDYKQGGTYSILVEHPQGTILHHGSAGFVPGLLKLRHADVVFLGIALMPDLRTYLSETVDAVGAKRVIPVHWDDFTRPLDEPLVPFPGLVKLNAFFEDMQSQRPDLKVQTLDLAMPVALFAK